MERGRCWPRSTGCGCCSFGGHVLFGLVALLVSLRDLGGIARIRRRRNGRIGGLSRLGLGGRRAAGDSAGALLGLQVLETLVDGLAHVVLHLLQVGQLTWTVSEIWHSGLPLLERTTRFAVVASGAAAALAGAHRRR